jgi:hypothetical protein
MVLGLERSYRAWAHKSIKTGDASKGARDEGELQQEDKVGDFRHAVPWLIAEAQRATSR